MMNLQYDAIAKVDRERALGLADKNLICNKHRRMTDKPQILSREILNLSNVPRFRMLNKRGSSLRITSIKAIRPPDKKTKEQEAEELRAQLQKEIEARARLCEYVGYECTMPVLKDYLYCARHILEDPSAPYRQCMHVYHNGDRCKFPAPISSPSDNRKDQGLCYEHARAAFHSRQKSAAPPPPVTTTETLLTQLQHYVSTERVRTVSCASSVSVVSDPNEQDQPTVQQTIDPFKQIDAVKINRAVSSRIMECASGSDSDADSITMGRGGNCRCENLSDIEFDDLPQPLRYAGVYTAEEAVTEAKNTLKLLQDAYKRQMVRLRLLLQNSRGQYLRSLRTEKEQYCSINSQSRSGPSTARERKQLRKLKAFASYHKKHGVEAILARKLHKKRAKASEILTKNVIHNRCTFTEGGVRCSESSLPASKHCIKHILEDKQQVLFVRCGDTRGTESCREPIAKLPLPSKSCRYHTDPPLYTTFTLKKEESESEQESISQSEYSQTEDGGENSIGEKSDTVVEEPVSFNVPFQVE